MSSAILPGTDVPVSIHEPTIDEILADPIVGLILRRDGLTASGVRISLDRERHRLAGRARPPVLLRAA